MTRGNVSLLRALPCDSLGVAECLSGILIDSLCEQWNRVQADDKEIAVLKRWLTTAFLNNGGCQKVADVHGAGLLMAAATVVSIDDARTFKSGREFVAWPGLVPTQTGTCGRLRQIGVSPCGDTYLRTLLMHGARSVIILGKDASSWRPCALRPIGRQRNANTLDVPPVASDAS